MRVSVIVPVYNVEKYLSRCIDSLLKQTQSAYEIILVDDGSTDSSGKIADQYAAAHKVIKTVHKQNEGLGMARNTGIEHAQGDAVLFLDSDDFFGVDLIKCLADAYEKNGADVVIGGYERVKDDGTIIGKLQYERRVYCGSEVKEQVLTRMVGSSPSLSDSISMGSTNTLYNLALIKQYGVRFVSEREFISEDIVFNIQFYSKAQKVCMIPETEYKYQVTANSLTTKYRADRYELSKNLYGCINQLLIQEGLYETCEVRLMKTMFNYWRMCFAQEKRSISKHTYMEQRRQILKICRDDLTKEIIGKYPVHALGKPQQLFVILVKYRMAAMIVVLIEKGFIKVE